MLTHQSKKNMPAFWVTNISNRNVTLADLALNIKAFHTVNLLDARHYSYTLLQLQQSQKTGSLYNKRHLIKIRAPQASPQIDTHKYSHGAIVDFIRSELPIDIRLDEVMPSREKSVLAIKIVEYDELAVKEEDQEAQAQDDEAFAKESVELLEDQPSPKVNQ